MILPVDNHEGYEDEPTETFRTLDINGLGFNHLAYQLGGLSEEKVFKVIKFAIDHVLSIEGTSFFTQNKSNVILVTI